MVLHISEWYLRIRHTIMALSRRKVMYLLILSFSFTLAVRTLHPAFENNGLTGYGAAVKKLFIKHVGIGSPLNLKLTDSVEEENNEILYRSVPQVQEVLEYDGNKYELINKNLKVVWTYRCRENVGCVRQLRTDEDDEGVVEPEVCWLTCGFYGSLWPYPTGNTTLGWCLVPFQPQGVIFNGSSPTPESDKMLEKMQDVFMDRFQKLIPESALKEYTDQVAEVETSYSGNVISIRISVSSGEVKIGLDTDESYWISIVSDEKKCQKGEFLELQVQINAATIFGARHALESLSQLLTFDRQEKSFQVIGYAEIKDSPAFPYRGLLIDTARTFIPIPDLKRAIDAMSYNKMNMLHWHLTDSNSFAFYSKRVPQMTQYGAYSTSKIYYPEDVRDLVQYALLRGVKIIPELDGPAHAGNGWQWGPSEGLGDLAVCVNAENWRLYSGQPPAGQLNPTNINVYITLENIYRDMLEEFDNDIFHMGGDEVYKECWQTDPNITEWISKGQQFDYMDVWGFFQTEAYKRLKVANSGESLRPILWTSKLTESIAGRKFLNSSDYIIQVWENGQSPVIQKLLAENYQLILSNSDAMYLDHGAGSWLGKEHVYAYKQWQVIYDNRRKKFLSTIYSDKRKPPSKRQILGGEATLWSEKVNSQNMDAKIWPRTSAMAENLWSDPQFRPESVYSRLNHHTNRMIQLGIRADQLQPESCFLLQGHCQDAKNSF